MSSGEVLDPKDRLIPAAVLGSAAVIDDKALRCGPASAAVGNGLLPDCVRL